MLELQSTSKHIIIPRERKLKEESLSTMLNKVPNSQRLLASELGSVVDGYRGKDKMPDSSIIEPGFRAHINWVKQCGHPLLAKKGLKIVDVGCGDSGSDYVHLLENELSVSSVDWVDRAQFFINDLKVAKERKHCMEAHQLGFPDSSFDIVYMGGVLNSGISRSLSIYDPIGSATGFEIVKEAARVLTSDGLLIISLSCLPQDELETLINLQAAGYQKISHLRRTIWHLGTLNDIYAIGKTAS